MSQAVSLDLLCYHCSSPCDSEVIRFEDHVFCCHGCQTVFQILNEHNLCQYYDLNEMPGKTILSNNRRDRFNFLANAEIRQKLIQFTDGQTTRVTFYIPQIHCSSCLWLLEHIQKINHGICSSEVNFTNKEVAIVYDETKTTLIAVVETLAAIGYEPHIALDDMDGKQPKHYNKSQLYKIGIAGFCFSNIMMMSLPEYLSGGHIGNLLLEQTFQKIIVALSLPVFFYSATTFFHSAWSGLKHRYLNIDLPISLAIIITFVRSLVEIFAQGGMGYMDSMSGIVFFMLIGRWFQNKTHQSLSFDRNYKSFFPIAVERLINGVSEVIPLHKLAKNDVITIYSNEIVPVDAILSKGKALIDYSFVNGESIPVAIDKGSFIYAGGKQIGEKIELLVMKESSQSYLTNLWNHHAFKEQKESKEDQLMDQIGVYFTFLVMALGLGAGGYWYVHHEPTLMWNAITTVLIVACPCALLLASTFTYGYVNQTLSQMKVYVRSHAVLKSMIKINHIVFDKTGTLTDAKKNQLSYTGASLESLGLLEPVVSLLANSNHPLSKAIYSHLKVTSARPIKDFKETIGQGIEGWIDDRHIKVGSNAFCGLKEKATQSVVNIWVDGSIAGVFSFSNTYRKGLSELVDRLKKQYKLSVLSGDNEYEAARLASIFGAESSLSFNQSPEDKLHYIESLQRNPSEQVMMIGDGLNDAGAFQKSQVGIALASDNNHFTPAADAIIDGGNLPHLDAILQFVKHAKTTVYTTFAISIIYNVAGLYFALQGLLSPVIAAILMPISSLSIILITYAMTQYFKSTYCSPAQLSR